MTAAGAARSVGGTPAAGSRIEVREAADLPDFAALQDEWRGLHDADPDASVFTSWEWMYHWWKHYGRTQALHVLVARVADETVGILPLYVQRQRVLGREVRVLRFVGTGGDTEPDYLGPVVAPGNGSFRSRIVETMLAHALDRLPGWDAVQLSDLREEAGLREQFAVACLGRGIACTGGIAAELAYVSLPATWEEYLEGVGGPRRYTIRNTRRRAEEIHGVRFFVESDVQRLDAVLDDLVDLHVRRWEVQGAPHAFSSPEYIGFHRDAVQACARRDWIRFYGIASGDRAIAVCYCYLWRGQVFYFQAGFDPACEKMRPGLVLIGYAVEHSIGKGISAFDFLRGEHPYKRQWGKGIRTTHVHTAYRANVAAALYRLRHERLPRAKARFGRWWQPKRWMSASHAGA